MNPLRLLLRTSRLARRTRSAAQVRMFLIIIAAIAALAGAEALFGWPDWLTPANNLSRVR